MWYCFGRQNLDWEDERMRQETVLADLHEKQHWFKDTMNNLCETRQEQLDELRAK